MTELESKGHGRTIVMSLIAVLCGGVAILWSWNTVAVDMFAHPEMEFRHAFAVEVALIAAGLLLGLPRLFKRLGGG